MTRTLAVLLTLILCGFAAYAGAGNPVVGKWDCVSVDEHGLQLTWKLEVKEVDGKLSASLRGGQDGDDFELMDPKLEGKTFTFKIRLSPEEIIEVTVTVEGDKFAGKLTGKSSGTGSFKGARM